MLLSFDLSAAMKSFVRKDATLQWLYVSKHGLSASHVLHYVYIHMNNTLCVVNTTLSVTFVNSEFCKLASGHQRPPKAVSMAQSSSSSLVHGWAGGHTAAAGRSSTSTPLQLGVRSWRPRRKRWQASRSASQMRSKPGQPQLGGKKGEHTM